MLRHACAIPQPQQELHYLNLPLCLGLQILVTMAEHSISEFKDKLLRALPSTRKKRDAFGHQDPPAESDSLRVPRLPKTIPVVPIADLVRMYFSSPIDKCVPSQSCSRCRSTRNKPGQTNTLIPAWPDRICLTFISKYASARCLQCYVFWMALSSMADSIPVGESVGYVGRLSVTIGGLKGRCHHFALCSTHG